MSEKTPRQKKIRVPTSAMCTFSRWQHICFQWNQPELLPKPPKCYRIHFPPLHPEVSHLNVRSSHRSQINRKSFCNFYCLDQLSGVSSGSRRKTNRQQGMPQLTGRWSLSVMKMMNPHINPDTHWGQEGDEGEKLLVSHDRTGRT